MSSSQLQAAAVLCAPTYSLSDVVAVRRIISRRSSAHFRRQPEIDLGRGVYFTDNREGYHEAEVEPQPALWLAETGYDIADFFGVPQLPGDISYTDDRVSREQELAEFADASFKITEHFKVTGGVRFSRTKFSFTENSNGPFGVGADLLPLNTSGSSTEHPVTPKLGASYDLPGGLIYATASKGYRIGGATSCCRISARHSSSAWGSTAPRRRTPRTRC